MIAGGSTWVPPLRQDVPQPTPAGVAIRASGAAGGEEHRAPATNERELTDEQRDEFEEMLRQLTARNSRPAVFCPRVLWKAAGWGRRWDRRYGCRAGVAAERGGSAVIAG